MKQFIYLGLFLLLTGTSLSQSVYPNFQDGKIWFKLKNEISLPIIKGENPYRVDIQTLPFVKQVLSDFNITKLSKPFFMAKTDQKLLRTYELHFSDPHQVDIIIHALKTCSEIEYAEKVPYDVISLTPNDYSANTQWYLQKINATGAWNYFSAGSTVAVAIVDNAIQRNHTDLNANKWVNPGEIANNGIDDEGNGMIDDINGYDVADNDNNPDPPNTTFAHGTHCAGDASASTNNTTGISGIGFSVKIMAVKAEGDASGPNNISDGYAGITYAANSGAKVISCSWGGGGFSSTGQNVITNAWNMGAIVVVAAGNSSTNTMEYPAAFTNALSVASTTSTDALSSFSNYGTWVDVCAPGSSIYSTVPTNGYGSMSGTSMACPIVAGLCGLMRSLNPSMTPAAVINCLTSSCDNINSMNPNFVGQLGAGRINANNAMACVASTMNVAPVANFSASSTTSCPNTPIQFTDLSSGNPTSWSWSFPGGSPSSSTLQNPIVTYANAGVYSVTLWAYNTNGNDSQVNSNYITISSTGQTLPLVEGFEGTTFVPTGGTPRDVGSTGIFWVRDGTVGKNSSASAFFDNYTLDAAGARDEMWTPKVNLTSLSTCTLNFDVAYARYDATYSDSLAVYVSTNCGSTWTQVYLKGGNSLSTNGQVDVQNAMFVPTSTQWRNETVNLNPYIGQSSVLISFQNRGHWGQTLHVDNVNIHGNLNTGLDNFSKDLIMELFPNPNNGTFEIHLNAEQSDMYSIELYNSLGQVLFSESNEISGNYAKQFNVAEYGAGIYFVKVKNSTGTTTKKVIVY